jgi:hypothetical protein
MGNAPAIHPPGDHRNLRRPAAIKAARILTRRIALTVPTRAARLAKRRPPVEDDRKREDEWFRANEKKLIEEARLARERREKERAAQEAASERERLKKEHFMKCPKCGHDLKEEDLQGVKVDRCTFCEGLYFDAGELDQVLLKKDEDRKGFFRRLVKI